jgi:hypothetical protein
VLSCALWLNPRNEKLSFTPTRGRASSGSFGILRRLARSIGHPASLRRIGRRVPPRGAAACPKSEASVLLYFLTSALGFLLNIAIVIWAARWLATSYQSRLVALVGAGFVGIALSVVADFTLVYSVDGYDRSMQAVIERGIMGGLLAMIVGYLAIRRRAKGKME